MALRDDGFTRVYRTGELGAARQPFGFRATAGECAALARRLGLESLAELSVTGTLRRLEDDQTVRLEAAFTADIEQLCVVSLEPVERHLDERLELVYKSESEPVVGDGLAVAVAYDEPDPPEPLVDGAIDIGAAVVEHLALAIDPYPRKEDVLIPSQYADHGDARPELRDHPLATLRSLTEKG